MVCGDRPRRVRRLRITSGSGRSLVLTVPGRFRSLSGDVHGTGPDDLSNSTRPPGLVPNGVLVWHPV